MFTDVSSTGLDKVGRGEPHSRIYQIHLGLPALIDHVFRVALLDHCFAAK